MLVLMNSPGPSIERSTCDSAARCNNRVGLERTQQFADLRPVADIALLKAIVRAVLDRPQRGEIGGIGQFVEIEHIDAQLATNSRHNRRPDKSGAAGHHTFIGTPKPRRNVRPIPNFNPLCGAAFTPRGKSVVSALGFAGPTYARCGPGGNSRLGAARCPVQRRCRHDRRQPLDSSERGSLQTFRTAPANRVIHDLFSIRAAEPLRRIMRRR